MSATPPFFPLHSLSSSSSSLLHVRRGKEARRRDHPPHRHHPQRAATAGIFIFLLAAAAAAGIFVFLLRHHCLHLRLPPRSHRRSNRGKQAGDDDVEMAEGRNNKVADGGGFGMVLLEMRTGMRALDTGRPALQHSLVEWAKPYLADRRKLAWLVDPRLEGQYPSRAAQQAAQLTLRCLSGDPRSRPSMAEVVAQRPPVLPRRHPLQPTSSSLSRRPLQPASSPLRRPGAGER